MAAFLDNVVAWFGASAEVLTDQGREFDLNVSIANKYSQFVGGAHKM